MATVESATDGQVSQNKQTPPKAGFLKLVPFLCLPRAFPFRKTGLHTFPRSLCREKREKAHVREDDQPHAGLECLGQDHAGGIDPAAGPKEVS